MADPLSIAGLVIAVVQGGFQLYAGLSEYLDAVDARSEELDFARRQAMDMRRSLEIIEQLAPKLASQHAASSSSLESCLRSCELDMNVLNDLLVEMTGPGPSGEGLRRRLCRVQVQAVKLTFPFDRSKIERLEKRLAISNGSLSTALSTANLEVSLVTQGQVSDIFHLLTVMMGANTSEARVRSPTRALSYQSRSLIGSDSLNSRNALLQLVSKPGYLKSAIGELQTYSQEPLHQLSNPMCSCRSRRTLTRQRQTWPSFALSYEKLLSTTHDPDCEFAGLTATQQTSGMTFEYNGLRNIFQKAVHLSFHLTFGAGGWSVNPGISFVPLVDERTAPAFRLVRLLLEAKLHCMLSHDRLSSIEIVMNNISSLYHQRRASPRDTDTYGQSLMHHMARTLTEIQGKNSNRRKEEIKTWIMCMKKLIASGVPAMSHDIDGRSPAMIYLQAAGEIDFGPTLATSLTSAEPDGKLFSKLGKRSYTRLDTRRVDFAQWPALEEAAEYGQLCSACAQGDQAAVSNILATKPSALRERTIFGQSPLHLAAHHPSCLKLLIEATGTGESLSNVLDEASRSPLNYITKEWRATSPESLEILLEADCAVWQNDASCFDERPEIWKPIIKAMRNRRERLKHLAIKELDDAEIEAFGLEEKTVLDGNAGVVWRSLLNKGITVPQALKPVLFESDRSHESMYHSTRSLERLEDLWTLNFRDINMLNNDGMPPLMDSWLDDMDGNYGQRCEWFIQHGANIEQPLRSGDVEEYPIAVCHNMFRLVGTRSFEHKRFYDKRFYDTHQNVTKNCARNLKADQAVIKELFKSTLNDACCCKCSRQGCTPFVWFLKYLPVYGDGSGDCFWEQRVWPTENRPDCLADSIKLFTESFKSAMSQGHLSEAVRCLTHAALGIKHTCCEAAAMRSPTMSAHNNGNRQHMGVEERHELESEQASLIDLLDSLVAEFEEKSLEDRDGAPLWRADPAEFWSEIWASRMNGVIEDLDGADLTSEEIRAAEDIGVEWKSQSPKPERPPSTRRRRDSLTFEEFKEEVDRIMSECK